MEFLALCKPHDSRSPDVDLPNGVVVGRRTVLYRNAWIDTSTAAVLLPELRKTVLARGSAANWNATSVRWPRRHVVIPGRVFVPLNTGNYFHLLLENGVRLLDLLDSGLVADRPLTVAHAAGRGHVETAMYQGIRALHAGTEIREVPQGNMIDAEEAVAHFPKDNYWEWPPVGRAGADRLAEAFRAAYGTLPSRDAEILYLSRAGSKLRSPLNEEALVQALASLGADIFTATDGNHPEQIARFSGAKCIVAVHGAGLTNLVFARPGSTVVEIFPSNFVKSPYWRLAKELGLEYTPVIAGPGDYDQRFEVDVGAVLKAVSGRGRG